MFIFNTSIDNIRRIRKEKGISQEKLAELCDTTTSYIGLMETYHNVPKLSTIERIANALHLDPLVLFIPNETNTNENKSQNISNIKEEIMSDIDNYVDKLLRKYM